MRNGFIKVFNHLVDVRISRDCSSFSHSAHAQMQAFCLAHESANYSIATVDVLLNRVKNFIEIFLATTEPGGTKQENFFALYRLSKKLKISLLQCPLSVQNQHRGSLLQARFRPEVQNSVSFLAEGRRGWHRPIGEYCRLRC